MAKTTMDFSTLDSQSNAQPRGTRPSVRVWALLFAAALNAVLAWAALAHANEAESVRLIEPQLSVDAQSDLILNGRVAVKLSGVLIEAVKRGVPLHFVTEFELSRKRWYWLDDRLIAQAKNVRISYHAVTQQYRVAIADVYQASYPTLDEALSGALLLKDWQLASAAEMESHGGLSAMVRRASAFEVRLRVRLDSGLLPKPLQINALTNRDWNLSSDWVALKLPDPTPSGQGGAPAANPS